MERLQPLRLPPRVKVLEALGAIADGRVKLVGGGWARVVSSEGDRVYTVYVDPERRVAYSDDNGTKLRGYVGYPVLAVLMMTGVVTYDGRVAEALKGIPWRRLNESMRSYRRVEEHVKRIASQRGVDPSVIDALVSKVMRELARLGLRKLPAPPPRGEAQA